MIAVVSFAVALCVLVTICLAWVADLIIDAQRRIDARQD